MWWGILLGIGYSIVLGLIMGVPTLRLRADYLAIVTIAVAEVVRLIVRSVKFRDTFGGTDGIKRLRRRRSSRSVPTSGINTGRVATGSWAFTFRARTSGC